MEEKKTIFDMKPEGTRGDEFKRKVNVIKEIAMESALAQLEDKRTLLIAGGIGLYQGLKYKGSLSLGMKAGIASLGVMVGITVANGLIEDIDKIKKA